MSAQAVGYAYRRGTPGSYGISGCTNAPFKVLDHELTLTISLRRESHNPGVSRNQDPLVANLVWRNKFSDHTEPTWMGGPLSAIRSNILGFQCGGE